MANRVSHSLLDPLFFPLVAPLYRWLPIPRRFPPEGIIVIGHLLAIAAAVGFAFSITTPWGGWLAAIGVAGNHIADMVDGTHARKTNQCRNGGELLDHFTDPLSFCYWMIGIGIAANSLPLAIASILWIYATAVLTNIKAKLTGEFTLARIGPTEFKSLLVVLAVLLAVHGHIIAPVLEPTDRLALVIAWFLAVAGTAQLVVNLIRAVIEVNRSATKADTTEWQLGDPDQQENQDST